ncbi:MAG: ABC transporter ATP-binding protein [Candidatus Heimdallarchaeaceae archaeon]
MVSVKYKDVSIAYDDFIAIKGVSLDVPDGEITTLLGPSGCGKSTLLRSLAGFVEPYEGQIYIGEREVTILPPQKRNTAMIFQNYALWPHLSIFDNVEYGLKLRLKQRIVYTVAISDADIITKATHLNYGTSDYVDTQTTLLEGHVEGKSAEKVWNLTLDDIRPLLELSEPKNKLYSRIMSSLRYKERSAKFLLGALRTAIRDHYGYKDKILPSWLPERKTGLERKKIRTSIWHRFLWTAKPYFWVNKKANYLEFKASKNSNFAFRKNKVEEVLDMVHLRDQIEKHPNELSGGQQQRIALARSIVVEPDVLLCDEPLSNLDAKLRKELRTEIRSIIKKIGMTALYVTHDQAEALAISDLIAVMNIGFIEQYGTPTEVFTDPHTLFVGQFIGSSSTLTGKAIASNMVELPGGEQVKTVTKKPLEVGSDVSLVIRPEVVSLTQQTDSPIDVEINTIEYLGNEVKLTGTLKDDTLLLIDIAEQTEDYAKMNIGDVLKAHIISEDIFVFVDEKRVY